MGVSVGIVERAAAKLGAVRSPDGKGTGADAWGGAAEAHKPDLIERAIGMGGPQAETVNGEGQVVSGRRPAAQAQPEPDRTLAARRNPPILEIQKQWLRQQNFITPDDERTPIGEGFRRIKRRILANVTDPAGNLVMVTSALQGEGKTFCAVNLAISIAMEVDRTVLLVDADTARPNVLPALGLQPGLPGLMDVLVDRSIDVADVVRQTSIEKLSILPAGTPNRLATEMLASEAMRTLIRELGERYDDRIVIFDSPPLLAASEAVALAAHMSQIVVVITAEQTTEVALKNALSRLEGCKHVGLLLNKGQDPGADSGYGYGYGYG